MYTVLERLGKLLCYSHKLKDSCQTPRHTLRRRADVLEVEGLQAWLDRWGQPQHGGQQPLVAGAGGTGADRPPAEFVRDVREVAKYVGESSEEEEDE